MGTTAEVLLIVFLILYFVFGLGVAIQLLGRELSSCLDKGKFGLVLLLCLQIMMLGVSWPLVFLWEMSGEFVAEGRVGPGFVRLIIIP